MRPGTNQSISSQSPATAAPVDLGDWLIAGITTQGPVTPQPASSLSQWQSIYGGRGTNPIMSDSVEAFFNEGGSTVWTARVVGPNAAFASVNLKDSSSAASCTVTADGPGAYANGIQIVVALNAAATLLPPAAPTLATAATGGTVAAGQYTIEVTYVDASGETTASASAQITTTGSTSTLTVTSPPAYSNATGWYAYVSAVNGSTLYRQQTAGSPTAIGTNLTLTAPPTTSGLQPPSSNTTQGYSITVENSSGTVLESSLPLVTVSDAVAYGQTSAYVDVTATGANPPASGTFLLSGGLDDISEITATQYSAALALFSPSQNPNIPLAARVSCPGQTTAAILEAGATFAATTDYVFYGDMPDAVSSASTLAADAAPITAMGTAARQVGLFAPWLDLGPSYGTTGNRGVPPSAFAAGRKSALIAQTGNPNQAAAGPQGILSSPVDVHETWSDSDRQTLNTAGINIIRPTASGFTIYGDVTAVNRLTDPLYFQLSCSELDGAIAAQAKAIQNDFMFTQIDGQGTDAANYGAALIAMMTEWFTLKALYGPDGTANTAFSVDTGSDVNTPTTIASGELIATIAYARTPSAEQVNLNIVRVSAATGV